MRVPPSRSQAERSECGPQRLPTRWRELRLAQHLAFNFFDEEWQVGARETQFRGRDAMMFDVWQYVFMVRVRRGQRGVIRVPCEPA